MRAPRAALAEKGWGEETGFRWRGGAEISRLEGFSDTVFAFALTHGRQVGARSDTPPAVIAAHARRSEHQHCWPL